MFFHSGTSGAPNRRVAASAWVAIFFLTFGIAAGCIEGPSGTGQQSGLDMGEDLDQDVAGGDMKPTDDGGDRVDMTDPFEDMTTPEDMGEECTPKTEAELCAPIVDQGSCVISKSQLDGCGNSIQISCACKNSAQECVESGGSTACEVCQPESDEALCELKDACGPFETTDRCGQTRSIDCGTLVCETDEACNESTNACECVPRSDAILCETALAGGNAPADCGMVEVVDNCGVQRTIDCGGCEGDGKCEENICDNCQPEDDAAFCQRLSRTNNDVLFCGPQSGIDNCGNDRLDVDCGAPNNCDASGRTCCTSPADCMGQPLGSCVCEPIDPATACRSGQNDLCEEVSNACGDTTTCTCPGSTDMCNSGVCCTPETNAELCAIFQGTGAKACGLRAVMDRCGQTRTIDCGGCGVDESCNGNNRCECDAVTCGSNSCGMLSNECGNSADCGGCTGAGETCDGGLNQCVCIPESDAQLCADAGHQCGAATVMDKCLVTRTINCGVCSDFDTCVLGSSGNDPNTCQIIEVETTPPVLNQYFGSSVDIHAEQALVGAAPPTRQANFPQAKAYRLDRDAQTNGWPNIVQLTRPSGSHDYFGYSVGISGTGIIIGSPNFNTDISGNLGYTVYYPLNTLTSNAVMQSRDQAGEGTSVAIVDNVNTTYSTSASGAPFRSGTIGPINSYVIPRIQNTLGVWSDYATGRIEAQTSTARMGTSVSMTRTVMAVGLPGDDEVRIYTRNTFGAAWQPSLVVSNQKADIDFGASVALSDDARYLAVGGLLQQGASTEGTSESSVIIYALDFTGVGSATPVAVLNSMSAYFGQSLAFEGNGLNPTLYVGNPGRNTNTSGEVLIYERQSSMGGAWALSADSPIRPPTPTTGDFFGYAMAIHGDKLIVGAPGTPVSGITRAGKVYIFTLR